MKNFKMTTTQSRILKIFGVALFLFIALYFIVFGRALRQGDDHVGIALALPAVLFHGGVAEVNTQTYVAKDAHTFRAYLESREYVFIDQLGSSLFYDKRGTRYMVTGRMYSRFFMVFHVYAEDKK